MIKIELQFETGAEARKALADLLGYTQVAFDFPAKPIKDEKTAENFEAPKMEIVADETPTKKRRTKAEIEAEKNAQPAAEETVPDGADIQEETKPAEETTSAVTAKMLQDKAVSVIRLGKKEEVTKLLEKFGAKSISQADKSPLKAEDYAAVMDELNKL